jgi:hypothetical protein
MAEGRRAFPLRYYVIAFVVIILAGFAPLIGLIAADAIASAHGCALNEGTINVCMVMGSDWGEGLYAAFVLAWLLLATLPLAGGAVLVLLVIFIIHRLAWGRMQKVKHQ